MLWRSISRYSQNVLLRNEVKLLAEMCPHMLSTSRSSTATLGSHCSADNSAEKKRNEAAIQREVTMTSYVPDSVDAAADAVVVNTITITGIVAVVEIGYDHMGRKVVQMRLNLEESEGTTPLHVRSAASPNMTVEDISERYLHKTVLVQGALRNVPWLHGGTVRSTLPYVWVPSRELYCNVTCL